MLNWVNNLEMTLSAEFDLIKFSSVGIMQGISDVGIMALNPNPHWFVSSLGAIFAGGLR